MIDKPQTDDTSDHDRNSQFLGSVHQGAVGNKDRHDDCSTISNLGESVTDFDRQGHSNSNLLVKTNDFTAESYGATLRAIAKDRFVILLFGFCLGTFYALYTVQTTLNAIDFSQFCTTEPAVSGNH